MARINYPTTIEEQTVLLDNIVSKMTKNGADSPIIEMLSINNIDLNADVDTGIKALANNTLFMALEKQSHNHRQQRDKVMKPILKHLRGCFKNIKSFNSPNFKAVGDWGGTITDGGKISYPTDTSERIKLLLLLKKKQDSYTDSDSPLLPFLTINQISLEEDATKGAAAIESDIAFNDLMKKALKAREDRDKDWKNPMKHIRKVGKYLKTSYPNNVNMLGLYGFLVVLAAKVAKKRTIKMGISANKLGLRTKVGRMIENLGTGDLYLYKGKQITGTPLLLKAATKLKAVKGYSIFSVTNLSATEPGKFMFLPL